jgi:hypothetical protein
MLYGTINGTNSNGLRIDAGGVFLFSRVAGNHPRFGPAPGAFGAFASTSVFLINMENMPMVSGLSFPNPIPSFFSGRQTGTVTLAAGTATVTASVVGAGTPDGSGILLSRISKGAGITGTSLNPTEASMANNTAANVLGSFVITDQDITGATIVTSVSKVRWQILDPRSSVLAPSQGF